jgi:multiple antibiotic resistance protein
MISLFLTTIVSLFSLINPLSAIPVFMSLTANYRPDQLRTTVIKTAIYVFIVCLVSFYIGVFILDFFGITIHALQLAGAIIISRSGFLLLNAQHKNDIQGPIMEESEIKEDISFSPLAMPLLAGPGSISLLINLSISSTNWKSNAVIIGAIIAVCFLLFSILYAAPRVLKYMGQGGLRSMSKIMGFIVLALGIQMAVDSLKILFEFS